MKTKLMTVLLSAASVLGFAAETTLPVTTHELKQNLISERSDRNWFGYMRMGMADSRPTDVEHVLPGLGLGFRHALPVGAIDVSASYTGDEAFRDETQTYFYTLPRVSYFYYTSPTKQQSFYGGAGLAYGGLKTKEATTFDGLIPSVSVGYEMNRLQNWRSFIQLDVSQPAFATSKNKPFFSLASIDLGPVAEFSVGFGY